MSEERDWRELYRDKRRLFVVLSIIVPFIAYCGYYYGMMIKNAAYRSDQFEYVEYKKFVNGKLREHLDSRAGTFTYYTTDDSLVTRHVTLSHATLKSIHFLMMDILFWNIRTVSGDSSLNGHHNQPFLYYVKAAYLQKSKVVWYEPHYFEDQKLDERMKELLRNLRSVAVKNIVP